MLYRRGVAIICSLWLSMVCPIIIIILPKPDSGTFNTTGFNVNYSCMLMSTCPTKCLYSGHIFNVISFNRTFKFRFYIFSSINIKRKHELTNICSLYNFGQHYIVEYIKLIRSAVIVKCAWFSIKMPWP